MLEGLPYVAILLLLLLLVLFLILLFIFLFLLCASRLSTRQSKVDGTLAASPFLLLEFNSMPQNAPDRTSHRSGEKPMLKKNRALACPAGWLMDRRYSLSFFSGTWASSRFGRYTLNDAPRGLRAPPTRVRLVQLSEIGSNGTYSIGSASSRASGSSRERGQCLPSQGAFRRGCRAESNGQGCDRPDPPFTRLSLTWAKSKRAATCSTGRCKARRSGTTRSRPRVSSRS